MSIFATLFTKRYLEYFKTRAVTTANKKKSNTVFGIMNKTNMNYTAPEVEIISIETQNCFASGERVCTPSGLNDLTSVDANWD